MKTPSFVSAVSICLLGLTLCSLAFAQSTISVVPSIPVIIVSGSATVEATPDQAIVRIGIVHEGSTARAAQDDASRIGQAIVRAITALGVPAARIQTSRLSITPMYAQPKPGSSDPPRIVGYSASNSVSVILDNLAQIGPVVDSGLENGANRLEGVQFRLKDDATIREQALKQAVAEARGKAAAMASAMSVTLGPVQELSETGSSVTPLGERNEAVFAMAARSSTPTPVSVGQIEVSASVTLKYAIVAKN
jgi:uncharacterized protein